MDIIIKITIMDERWLWSTILVVQQQKWDKLATGNQFKQKKKKENNVLSSSQQPATIILIAFIESRLQIWKRR